MNQQPIFFKPIFQERIWGGTELTSFGYAIPSHTTGECWAFAAHSNGQSVVKNGPLQGKTLGELWGNHRYLFGDKEGDRFPLLTKILDANDDLSVQVHPNDEYAKVNENGELGKTECWYIIDCDENADMIFGHHAHSKEEFIQLINEGKWDHLLQRIKIKPGDFFYVPSGTIHALCKGTLVLETQQSSDTTYRVYDYDRHGQDGKPRELHLDKAIEVTTVPHKAQTTSPNTMKQPGGTVTTYVNEEYFSVYKWEVESSLNLTQDKHFYLCSVINGNGYVRTEEGDFKVENGDHFILPYGMGSFTIEGKVQIIASHPNNGGTK